MTIEGNAFRHTGSGAIQVETGYTRDKWSEGYGVSNVVIRGNLFDNANPVGARTPQLQPVVYAGVYRPKDIDAPVGYPILRDILIERNVFRDSYGVAAYLSNVQDVTVRDNLLADSRARLKDPPCRAQFRLVQAKNVRVVNNVWRPSPHVAAPGVTWDSENCTGVVAEGNRVKEKDASP